MYNNKIFRKKHLLVWLFIFYISEAFKKGTKVTNNLASSSIFSMTRHQHRDNITVKNNKKKQKETKPRWA